MRINIILGGGDSGWIIGRMARELEARLPAYGIDVTINGDVADLEHHPVVYGDPTNRPAVGTFTHGDFRPKRYASVYDGHIGLNSSVHGYLKLAAAPNAVLIEPVVDEHFHLGRPLIFGVAGRTYGDGRKGEHLIAKMIAAGYHVIAWGYGWPCEIFSTKFEDLRTFYQMIDYYVDTAHDEGGCVPAFEATAMGVPVISHTVGVSRPVLAYERSDWDSLERVLRYLTTPRGYDDWAREHATYFKAVLSNNWSEFWERSAA